MIMSRPNILLLVTDEQRWDTVSAYGFNDMRELNDPLCHWFKRLGPVY
jgi:arylsulfatase A-like enzyme